MVRVTTEIGRLRKVLVHEPGPEVDRMVPPMMEELLFDDILFGDRARDEHRRFRRLLQLLGIEVVEANALLAEALANEEGRAWLWARLRPEAPQVLRADEPPASAEEAVAIATTGLLASEDCRGIEVEDIFRLPPLPNWCFQRDPQVVLGNGVIFSAMATAARWAMPPDSSLGSAPAARGGRPTSSRTRRISAATLSGACSRRAMARICLTTAPPRPASPRWWRRRRRP